MDKVVHKVRSIKTRLEPDWDQNQLDHLFQGTQSRVRRKRAIRAIGRVGSVALLLAFCVGLWHVLFAEPSEVDGFVYEQRQSTVRELRDGSQIVELTNGSDFSILEQTSEVISVKLARGTVRFDVTPRKDRSFHVYAGSAKISVLGTSFTVRRETEGVEVEVHYGRVKVENESVEKILAARETWRSVQTPVTTKMSPEPQAQKIPQALQPRPTVKVSALVISDETEPDPDHVPRETEPETMDGLLAKADGLRRAGSSQEAIHTYDRAIELFPDDQRAPLAAFTMARMMLDGGHFEKAALHFARARQLAPTGSLAEDTLAREVEAWSRAGNTVRAKQRAKQYFLAYPQGRRSRLVRRYGGFE